MAKKMKKLLSLVLVLSMILSMGSAFAFADTEGADNENIIVSENQDRNEDETLTEGVIPEGDAAADETGSADNATIEADTEEPEETIPAVELAVMSLRESAPDYKVMVEVSSTLENGDVTMVTGTVYDDYSARLVLPRNAHVNAGNVTVGVTMKDIASMGIEGEKSHSMTLETGAQSGINASLDGTMTKLYGFNRAAINATIVSAAGEAKTVRYDFGSLEESGAKVITATADTDAARAAWQLMMKDNFEFVTDKEADSYIVIANGSSMQIGNEKLVFEKEEGDLKLDNFANGFGELNNTVRDAVKLETVEDSAVTFTLKAGTELAVDQSSAKLVNDVTVTVDANAAEFGEVLSALRECQSMDEMLMLAVFTLDGVVGAINDHDVDVTIEFTEPPVVKDYKVKVDVSSELENGDVTAVTGTVYDDYSAELVLPRNAHVNASNVTVGVTMKDIASMGIEGEKSHSMTLETGAQSGINASLDGTMTKLYGFNRAAINATIVSAAGKTETVKYDFAGSDIDGNKVITATADTDAARAAWQLMMKDNFEFVTDKEADSYIVIANGSSMQIGNEKLVFEKEEGDLKLDNFANGFGELNNTVRDAVKLETVEDSAVTFTLKAGTELAVDQSSAKLVNDVTVTVDANAAEFGEVLSALRECQSMDEMLMLAVFTLDGVVGAIDGQTVGVTIEFTCEHVEDEGEITVQPTCTATGVKTFKCTKCGEVLRTETVNATGHTMVIDPRVEPTCTETGLTEGSHCTRCDDATVAQEVVAALGHTPVVDESTRVPATYDAPGHEADTVCSVCGITLENGAVIPQLVRRGGGGGSSRPVEITEPDVPLASAMPFDDVTENNWFHEAVQFVYDNDLMNGVGETTFDPYADTTRGMIVTILWRLEGSPEATSPAAFTDVAEGKYYTKAVAWAVENGVVTGYSDEIFAPERNISRQEMAAILYRYAGIKKYDVTGRSEITGFVDANEVHNYAVEALQWSVNVALVEGRGNNNLAPTDGANRAEAAALLMRFVNTVAKADAETE